LLGSRRHRTALPVSCRLSRIASSTRVFDAVARALRGDSRSSLKNHGARPIAAAQRTPARLRGDLCALRDPRCAVVGLLVKRNREDVRTLPGSSPRHRCSSARVRFQARRGARSQIRSSMAMRAGRHIATGLIWASLCDELGRLT
ncbi:MAG TPA: hypothetical protein VK601_30810, partial [Kofleriaceae bacterium]|nr:hypothetical protein [Kofleriaceae bacterium]